MGTIWTGVSDILREIMPAYGGENQFSYLSRGGFSWKLIVTNEKANEEIRDHTCLIRMEYLEQPGRARERIAMVYELFWPTGASIPSMQHAARGYLYSTDKKSDLKGLWVARTDDMPTREFTPGGIVFSEGCLGWLSGTAADEEFLENLRYLWSQIQPSQHDELHLNNP